MLMVPAPVPVDPAMAAPRSVFLVDDTDDIRRLLRLALSADHRFTVAGEAANGKDAIEALSTMCPDFVLLDVNMPVMSGLEALPAIVRACPDTRVFILSSEDGAEVAAEALRLGAVRFVSKTTPVSELKEILASSA